MDRKIRVGAVNYLNTKPLIYGFELGMMADELEMSFDYPSIVAEKIILGEIDIGLLPVAILPFLPEHYIISDYCIGCNGAVDSVCLFSEVPVEDIKTILLDYQSKTSVALLKVLLREYWKISPRLVNAHKGYESEIKGFTAGLVIGDRAFSQKLISALYYDLGTAWKEMTGLPFVFAAWVSIRKMEDQFANGFNAANAYGLNCLKEVIKGINSNGVDLENYYNNHISYQFDALKNKAMQIFLEKISHGVL